MSNLIDDPNNENYSKDVFDKDFWRYCRYFGLSALVIFALPVIFTSHGPKIFDFTSTGQIGDTIGGITAPFIGLLVAALTFLAFWIQYKANEQQKQEIIRQRKDITQQKLDSKLERIEARFFELLKFHRENVAELRYTYPARRDPYDANNEFTYPTAEGRKVFKIIHSHFEEVLKETKHFFTNADIKDIYIDEYLKDLQVNDTLKTRNVNYKNYAKIDILYLIIFFGVSKSGEETITNFLKKRYKSSFYEPLLFFASLKPKKDSPYWSRWKGFIHSGSQPEAHLFLHFAKTRGKEWGSAHVEENFFYTQIWYDDDYEKYYGGHQFRLGHYFRHFFQTINYINDEPLLTYPVRKNYVSIYRTQLSTYEQIIFFLNSVSILGRIWELENKFASYRPIALNKQLVTKYNMIKNIPNDTVFDGINASSFYPDVIYESTFSEYEEENHPKRKELLKIYNSKCQQTN